MSARRIHLAAPGGGAACGAHSLGKPAGQRDVLASHLLALVDCRACVRTDQYRHILNPPRQLQLRLFRTVTNEDPPQRLTPADLSTKMECHRVRVLLNGEPLRDVVGYDAGDGWVERYRRDDRGNHVLQGGRLATERLRGTVTVEWKRAA